MSKPPPGVSDARVLVHSRGKSHFSLAVDRNHGILYYSTRQDNRLFSFALDGSDADEPVQVQEPISCLRGIAFDHANQRLAVCNMSDHIVRMVQPDTGRFLDGYRTEGQHLDTMAVDVHEATGKVIVGEWDDRRVTVFDSLTEWNRLEIEGCGNVTGVKAVERDGEVCLYVSDNSHDQVILVRPDGTEIQRFAAQGPRGIDVDDAGNVAIASCSDNCVLVYDKEGNEILRFTGEGDENAVGKLNRPSDVKFDGTGGLICADWNNDRVVWLPAPF